VKSTKPRITVELEPGDYLVSVHPSHRSRVWRVGTDGTVTGHGSKLRRVAVWDALVVLTVAAEREEGIT